MTQGQGACDASSRSSHDWEGAEIRGVGTRDNEREGIVTRGHESVGFVGGCECIPTQSVVTPTCSTRSIRRIKSRRR